MYPTRMLRMQPTRALFRPMPVSTSLTAPPYSMLMHPRKRNIAVRRPFYKLSHQLQRLKRRDAIKRLTDTFYSTYHLSANTQTQEDSTRIDSSWYIHFKSSSVICANAISIGIVLGYGISTYSVDNLKSDIGPALPSELVFTVSSTSSSPTRHCDSTDEVHVTSKGAGTAVSLLAFVLNGVKYYNISVAEKRRQHVLVWLGIRRKSHFVFSAKISSRASAKKALITGQRLKLDVAPQTFGHLRSFIIVLVEALPCPDPLDPALDLALYLPTQLLESRLLSHRLYCHVLQDNFPAF